MTRTSRSSRGAAVLPRIAGSPRPEQVRVLDPGYPSKLVGENLARAEGSQQQFRQRCCQRRPRSRNEPGFPDPPGGHDSCLFGPDYLALH